MAILKKIKNFKSFKFLPEKLNNKKPLIIILIISLLIHILLFLIFSKYAFLRKINFSFITQTRTEKKQKQNAHVFFAPEETTATPPLGSTNEHPEAPPAQIPSTPISNTHIEQEPITKEQKTEPGQQTPLEKEMPKEEEVDNLIPEERENTKQPKEESAENTKEDEIKKQESITSNQEDLKKQALANLFSQPQPQTINESNNQPNPRQLLLPEIPKNAVKLDGFLGIGEILGDSSIKPSLEELQQQTKQMCYVNKIFKEVNKNLLNIPNFKKLFTQNPPKQSITVGFRIEKNGTTTNQELLKSCFSNIIDKTIHKTTKKMTYMPPIPDHLNITTIDAEFTIDFQKGNLHLSLRGN